MPVFKPETIAKLNAYSAMAWLWLVSHPSVGWFSLGFLIGFVLG